MIHIKSIILFIGIGLSLSYSIWGGLTVKTESFDPIAVRRLKNADNDSPTIQPHPSTAEEKSAEYPFTFAACLMTKDDKQILPEWLAYHYTVLPLRHLIVAVDPLSITTPEPILDGYRSIGMEIEMWTGNWYWHDGRWSQEKKATFDPLNHTDFHAYRMKNQRQSAFYTHCLRRLRSMPNISWVLIVDTDEYFTYNSILPIEQVGGDGDYNNNITSINTKFPVRADLPQRTGKQNETIAHYIANSAAFNEAPGNKSLCTVYPRIDYSARDAEPTKDDRGTPASSSAAAEGTRRQGAAPPDFDFKMFHSLRFRFHRTLRDRPIPGKSLVNVANFNGKGKVKNPHRPFDARCDNDVFPRVEDDNHPFRVHHYSGSLETFLSRPERNIAKWQHKNNFTSQQEEHPDNSMSEWLQEFVTLVGKGKAFELTQLAREAAYNESIDLKERVEQHNEKIPHYFEWD
jgi:hypothetical protein